ARPRAGVRAANPIDGRAARGVGQEAPRGDAAGAQALACPARRHRHLCDPRPGGGADALGPRGRDEPGAHRAGQGAPRPLRAALHAIRRGVRRRVQSARGVGCRDGRRRARAGDTGRTACAAGPGQCPRGRDADAVGAAGKDRARRRGPGTRRGRGRRGDLSRRVDALRRALGGRRGLRRQAAESRGGRGDQGGYSRGAPMGSGQREEAGMSRVTRRYVLKMGVLTAATGTTALAPRVARAQAKQLVVCSWGGAYQEAQRKTMFQPFERETGIKVVEASPTDYGKLKAMVQSGNADGDLVDVGDLNVIAGTKDNLLEPLDYQTIDTRDVFPQVVHKFGIGTIYYSTVLAYSTK